MRKRFVDLYLRLPLFLPFFLSFSLFRLSSPSGLAPSSTARLALLDAPSVATRAWLSGRRARTTVAAAARGAAVAAAADVGEIDDDRSDVDGGASSPDEAAARASAASEDANSVHEGLGRVAGSELRADAEELQRREGGQRWLLRRAASVVIGVAGAVAGADADVLAEVEAWGIAAAELQDARDRIVELALDTPRQKKKESGRKRGRKRSFSILFDCFRKKSSLLPTLDPLSFKLFSFSLSLSLFLRRVCVYKKEGFRKEARAHETRDRGQLRSIQSTKRH